MHRFLLLLPLVSAGPTNIWSASRPGSANEDGNGSNIPWTSYDSSYSTQNSYNSAAQQNSLGNRNQNYNMLQYGDYIDPNQGPSSEFEQRMYFQQQNQKDTAQQTDNSNNGFFNSAYNLFKDGGNSLYGSLSLDELVQNVVDAVSSRINNRSN